MLYCDIILDFYPFKVPKKKYVLIRNCEDIKFQVLKDFVKFHGKVKVFCFKIKFQAFSLP